MSVATKSMSVGQVKRRLTEIESCLADSNLSKDARSGLVRERLTLRKIQTSRTAKSARPSKGATAHVAFQVDENDLAVLGAEDLLGNDAWAFKLDHRADHATTVPRVMNIFERLSIKTDNNTMRLCDALEASVPAAMGTVTRALANGNYKTLETLIERRSQADLFQQGIQIRYALRHSHKVLKRLYDYLKNYGPAQDITPTQITFAGRVVLEEYERLVVVRKALDAYKSVSARAMKHLEEHRTEEDIKAGRFVEYTHDALNGMVAIGSFPSGSREWLESRQNGIGGSDVGAIIGAVEPEYAIDAYREVLRSKVEPITDEDVEEENSEDFSLPYVRGNAWEEAILRMFTERNPNENVTHCKTSWRRSDVSHHYANFDGMLLDADGNPEGIVEIKTSDDPEHWGPVESGLDGVPAHYRAQVLWYTLAAGFTRGVLVALIDDTEYREYWFTVDEALLSEAEDNAQKVASFWAKVLNARVNGIEYTLGRRYGIAQTALKPGFSGKEPTLRTLGGLMGTTARDAYEVFQGHLETLAEGLGSNDQSKSNSRVCNSDTSAFWEARYLAYAKMYRDAANAYVNGHTLVGLDLETSGFSAVMGRIIELGISVITDGEETKRVSRLYDIPKKARRGVGVGAEEVHHISLDDIEGKDSFYTASNQAQVLELLKMGPVVAHNASYEDQWLKIHLDGYAEARANGEIVLIDTMMLSRHFMPGRVHTLENFSKSFGVPYGVNAHRAIVDVDNMMLALARFMEAVHAHEISPRVYVDSGEVEVGEMLIEEHYGLFSE